MEILLILCAYFIGAIPSGYVLGKLAGVDVRSAGSGNVGATNVARVVGKRQGILTLVIDVAKGVLPVVVGRRMNLAELAIACAGIAAFLGHLYPVYLKFKGGKGVATALGVFLALAPLATLVFVGVFAGVIGSSRIVSLGSIAAAAAAPIALWLLAYPPVLVGMGVLLAVMIVWRHRGNIQRLRAGTEPRFGSASSR
ncbi:MAG: glycerol-3-phosphate 1-O-acyltransferase PlsY [Deltaproteobacteria bacterium]|nr:glycerol-3-phosphate 1-O-acyltransferase PlsY [Deltaproteobacteria bacterium]